MTHRRNNSFSFTEIRMVRDNSNKQINKVQNFRKKFNNNLLKHDLSFVSTYAYSSNNTPKRSRMRSREHS